MKFLPIVEFEKRQKSINRNKTRAIMNSMMAKIGFGLNAPIAAPSIRHTRLKPK